MTADAIVGQDQPKLTRASVAKTYTGDIEEELQSLSGEGASAVGHGMEHPFTLTCELQHS